MLHEESKKRHLRCAIYTRKSTEEGLDQAFNSLDAQREACEAYIASQKVEGWKLIPNSYDDGGKSGGSLDRPALQALLADMRDGRIDLIVVYKIDRLTRSLSDFARLVDEFDAANCSFVSVTQSFNTSTSMGRLTLNVLLSFAQFEREVTAERIRDKFAASKRKGLWMGGLEPFGYTRHPDRKIQSLVIVPEEAEIVHTLFALYDHHGCISKVEREARGRGFVSRKRAFSSGRRQGGISFSQGYVHKILTNPIYLGKIRHKRELHEGLHEAIIDEALWTRVQDKLKSGARRLRGRTRKTETSPLAGKLFDDKGERLSPSHSIKNSRRYRYYVSKALLKGRKDDAGWRLPAFALERFVAGEVNWYLTHEGTRLLQPHAANFECVQKLQDQTVSAVEALHLVKRVEVKSGEVSLYLDLEHIAETLDVSVEDVSEAALVFRVPFQTKRRGVETRIIYRGLETRPDNTLIRAIAKAHAYLYAVKSGEMIVDIAKREGTDKTNIRRRLQLAFLSPRIVEKILAGEQPLDLNLERLSALDMPSDWGEQWKLLGFAEH